MFAFLHVIMIRLCRVMCVKLKIFMLRAHTQILHDKGIYLSEDVSSSNEWIPFVQSSNIFFKKILSVCVFKNAPVLGLPPHVCNFQRIIWRLMPYLSFIIFFRFPYFAFQHKSSLHCLKFVCRETLHLKNTTKHERLVNIFHLSIHFLLPTAGQLPLTGFPWNMETPNWSA